MGRPTKLQNLEKKFSMAETLVEELTTVMEDIQQETLPEPIPIIEEEKNETVLSMDSLRQDFLLVRNNIIKLVNTGQRILDSVSVLELEDLKASQLDALSNLQATLGNNLQLLISIYKDISIIEKSRQKPVSKITEQVPVVNGNVTNNQIMFSGSSAQLLELINTQMENSDK